MSDPDLNIQVPGEEQTPAPEPTAAKPAKPAKATAAAKPQAAAPEETQDKPTVEGGLPDQSTVDPDKITRAVLTRQGWVVPTAKPKA